MTVLVAGGNGFIGRHVVAALGEFAVEVVIGSRRPRRSKQTKSVSAGARQCQLRFEALTEPAAWAAPLAGVSAVINCVGILRQRPGESYRALHHQAPAALAVACQQRGIRLVHVSALGLDKDRPRSRFLSSKRDGERAIAAAGGDWTIVQPSLVDGRGGFGAAWLRRVANWPVHCVPRNACGLIAVLDARDVGEALARIALGRAGLDAMQREVGLGGPDQRTVAQYLQALRSDRGVARQLKVPPLLARLVAHVCDGLHFSPFSFGHYELLGRDNLPQPNLLSVILGRPPRRVGRNLDCGAGDLLDWGQSPS